MGLKGIPLIMSPQLLHVLSAMGHGDEIVLADVHFPTSSTCRNGPTEVRADGHETTKLLEAILQLFPLDEYVTAAVAVMEPAAQDKAVGLSRPPIWDEFDKILRASGEKNIGIEQVERFAFYERAKNAYGVVHSGFEILPNKPLAVKASL